MPSLSCLLGSSKKQTFGFHIIKTMETKAKKSPEDSYANMMPQGFPKTGGPKTIVKAHKEGPLFFANRVPSVWWYRDARLWCHLVSIVTVPEPEFYKVRGGPPKSKGLPMGPWALSFLKGL